MPGNARAERDHHPVLEVLDREDGSRAAGTLVLHCGLDAALRGLYGSMCVMDSQTRRDFWIMMVSTLVTVAVATITFAVFSQVH